VRFIGGSYERLIVDKRLVEADIEMDRAGRQDSELARLVNIDDRDMACGEEPRLVDRLRLSRAVSAGDPRSRRSAAIRHG